MRGEGRSCCASAASLVVAAQWLAVDGGPHRYPMELGASWDVTSGNKEMIGARGSLLKETPADITVCQHIFVQVLCVRVSDQRVVVAPPSAP